MALEAQKKIRTGAFWIYDHKHGQYDFDQVLQIAHLVPKIYPMCTGSDIFKTVLTWQFRNDITLGIWVGKCSCYGPLNFFFKIPKIALYKLSMSPRTDQAFSIARCDLILSPN